MLVDHLTGDTTFVSSERTNRPNEFRDGAIICAFCPGHERETPPEVAAYRNASGEWLVRAFPNKFPTVRPPGGDHEVIVDSRDHLGEVTALGVRMWHARYTAALERMPDATPVLFKNSGEYAGATLAHPHTQLLVVRGDVPRWRTMRERARAYRATYGSCAWCDEIARARTGETLVWEDDAYAAYTRDDARFNGALTIAPRSCAVSWRDLSGDDAQALGVHLVRAADALGDSRTPFNMLLIADPGAPAGELHWHFEVIPRHSTLAGFELSTGMYVKSGTAQESARRWRRTLAVLNGPV